MMQSFGGTCHPSPSELTDFGKKLLSEDPNNPGSLGIAISEAIEAVVKSEGKAKYALGSVLGHVLLHQTINGNEAILTNGTSWRLSRYNCRLYWRWK